MKVYILEHVVAHEGSSVISVHTTMEGAQYTASVKYPLGGWDTMDERNSIYADITDSKDQYVEITEMEVQS